MSSVLGSIKSELLWLRSFAHSRCLSVSNRNSSISSWVGDSAILYNLTLMHSSLHGITTMLMVAAPCPVFSINDPLFLHPSDSNVTLNSFHLTGPENYQLWSHVEIAQLQLKNKHVFVDGTCTRDSVAPECQSRWDQRNAVVCTWIMNVLSPDLVSGVLYIPTALQIWNDLRERFCYSRWDMRVWTSSRNLHFIAKYSQYLSILH